MLRVVLAVALAVALLGVASPAIDSARTERAAATVETAIDHLERTAMRLQARNDPVSPGRGGARRTVTVHLPRRSWGSAGLDYLRIHGNASVSRSTERVGKIRWRVSGGRQTTRSTSVALVGASGGVTFRTGGRTRVVLRLVSIDGNQTVLVSRPGFKWHDATTPEHDGVIDAGRPPPGRLR